MYSEITIVGARVHNLKNINTKIPLQKITCLVGPSGSGKTSLAIHTLLAESKRRFLVALPNSMKLFTEKPSPVDVDQLAPVLPVFGLNQHNPILSSRSNVADTLGLTDEFQKLFSLLSEEKCSTHNLPLEALKIKDQIKNKIKTSPEDILHFIVDKEIFKLKLGSQFLPARCWNPEKKEIVEFDDEVEFWELGRIKAKNLEDVDKFFIYQQQCLFDSFIIIQKTETGLKETLVQLNSKLQCPLCDEVESIKKSDFLFTPRNGLGACSHCQGFGANLLYDEKKYYDEDRTILNNAVVLFKMSKFVSFQKELLKAFNLKSYPTNVALKNLPQKAKDLIYQGYGKYPGLEGAFAYLESKKYKPAIKMVMRHFQSEFTCEYCQGSRLNPLTKKFFIQLENHQLNLSNLMSQSVEKLYIIFKAINLDHIKENSKSVIIKIQRILTKAYEVGLGHLELQRKAKSLSGGEYQRSLLIKFFSYDGTDSLFILDEPSLGISMDQWPSIWKGIEDLKLQGNTLLLIEHQDFFYHASDHIIELGPGSGKDGGVITYEGPPVKSFQKSEMINKKVKSLKQKFTIALKLEKPKIYKQQYSDVIIHKNAFHVVKGGTGTGKTSVLLKILANTMHRKIHDNYLYDRDGEYESLNIEHDFDSVIVADNNLKRYNSRSSVGSFTDLSLVLRKYYANTDQAKKLKLTESHFSTNSALGQCPICTGSGIQRVELQYMEDVILECDECYGYGLKRDYALITDGRMTVAEAFAAPLNKVFEKIPLTPKFQKVLLTLNDLKLSHLTLGRTMSSLSGGEKQRLNLVSNFLSLPKNSLLFFENLSFGLSKKELPSLVEYVKSLTSFGNTIILIDQNPFWDMVSDYVIHFKKDGLIETYPS